MKMYPLPFLSLLGLALSGPALAIDIYSPNSDITHSAFKENAEPTPMRADDLASVSAGESVKVDVLTAQRLTAVNSGNSVTANSVTSGDINFSGNALSGFNGVGNFVANTGNNNNLQGSISITIVNTPLVP